MLVVLLSLFVLFLYVASVLFFFNASSFVLMWILLEMNLISYVMCLLVLSNNSALCKKEELYKCGLYYFLIQTLATMLFIISAMYLLSSFFTIGYMGLLLSLFLKMGIPPFHSWMFNISEFLEGKPLSILLVMQKVPMLLIVFSMDTNFTLALILFSLITGSYMLYNSYYLKMLLVSSSIYGTIWVYLSYEVSMGCWLVFIFFYFYFLDVLCSSGPTYGTSNLLKDMIGLGSLFFLMGLPPFSLFFFKFFILSNSLFCISYFVLLLVWVFSFYSLMGYFKFFFKSIMDVKTLYKTSSKINLFVIISFFATILFIV